MKPGVLLFIFAVAGWATSQSVQSPQVHADRRVTFRLRYPNAKEVFVWLDGAERLAMRQDLQGAWSVTTAPLEPQFYGYQFVVDGVSIMDPVNPMVNPDAVKPRSLLHVPGPRSLPWESNDVPHGTVHHHFYKSGTVGEQRDYYVYTPPGYYYGAPRRYPVLYLLHGLGDGAAAWTLVGRAHVILDNLIARRRAKPMLVVMPLCYGAADALSWDNIAVGDAVHRKLGYEKFRDSLLQEVIPQVETAYRASKNQESRAIAGLSMGGAQSLYIGLNALDRFAWIGAFSAAVLPDDFPTTFPALDSRANAPIRLLWIACGTEDSLIDFNRVFRDWLKSNKIRHSGIEAGGAHTWMVWRKNLADFVPLLFQDRGAK